MKKKTLISTLICLALMLSTFSTLQTPSSSATYAKDKSTNLTTKTTTSEPSAALYSDIFNCPQLSSPMSHSQSNKIMGALTVTDPWPQHDELTENVDWPPLDPWDGFQVPGYGLWWEIYGGVWQNVMIVENRTYNVCVGEYSVMSRVRAFGIGDPYWIPHFVVFWPSEYLDLNNWHYIKYFICLGGYCDGFCQIGFFNGDIYGDYECAFINYATSNDNQFHPKSFDLTNHSEWTVSAGFNWSAVNGLAFFARTYAGSGDNSGLNDMWIDSPILYSGSTDVPYGLIDTDERETEYSKIGVELIHAGPEYLEQYDLYTIHMTVVNKGTKAGYCWFLPFVKVLIVMDDVASEYLANHEPQHGYYDYQSVLSFGVPGVPISFPITLPQLQVDYSDFYEDNLYKVQWAVSDPSFGGLWGTGRSVIKNNCYADFVITVKVPATFKPYVSVMAELQWYVGIVTPTGLKFGKALTEQICWLTVDPPEATPIESTTPNPETLPEEVPSGVDINSIQVRGDNFLADPCFEFNGFRWQFINGATVTDTISHGGGYTSKSAMLPTSRKVRQPLGPYWYGDEVWFECYVYSDTTGQRVQLWMELADNSMAVTQVDLSVGWNWIRLGCSQHKKISAFTVYAHPYNTHAIYVDDCDAYKRRNFEKGECYEVWLDVYWLNDGFPLSISVEMTDSSGEKIGLCALLASGWVHGNSACIFGLVLPDWAELGNATIRVGLWTNWKWEATADQYGWDTAMEFDIVG